MTYFGLIQILIEAYKFDKKTKTVNSFLALDSFLQIFLNLVMRLSIILFKSVELVFYSDLILDVMLIYLDLIFIKREAIKVYIPLCL